MQPDDFRQIALSMPDAQESAHMGHPDFRINGKIFATISTDGNLGMVKLKPDQQRGYLDEYPDTFVPASGAWGRQGSTMIRFSSADQAIVRGALQLACQNVLEKSKTKPPRRHSPRRKL